MKNQIYVSIHNHMYVCVCVFMCVCVYVCVCVYARPSCPILFFSDISAWEHFTEKKRSLRHPELSTHVIQSCLSMEIEPLIARLGFLCPDSGSTFLIYHTHWHCADFCHKNCKTIIAIKLTS